VQQSKIAYILLILTTIFWSGNFVVGKAATYYEIPPFSLNFFRWLFAGIVLLPFTIKEIILKKKYIFSNLGLFAILGITSITVFNSIVYYSLYHTQVINGILLISTIPVWIIFISSILNIEKTNILQILGLICSLIGVIFIITKANFNIITDLDFNKGDLSMVIAMLSWAIFSALLKIKKFKISQYTLLEVIIFSGLIFLVPVYILEINYGSKIIINTPFILTLSYVVIFPGLLAFMFWIKGISIIGANRAGIFLHLMPIFGSIFAIVIFSEKFAFYHLYGIVFIIAGLILSNKKSNISK